MDGYYDPHPTVTLERPLALIAFFGEDQQRVGRRLAGLTGLPFVDLDRWIEHDAGQGLTELVEAEGEAGLREREGRLLRQALRSRPAAVIALGDGALRQPANLRAVSADATLVYLRRDLAGSYWLLRRLEQRRGGLRHPFLPAPLEHPGQLRPAFDRRLPGYEAAAHHLDLAGKDSGRTAAELRRLLGPGDGG